MLKVMAGFTLSFIWEEFWYEFSINMFQVDSCVKSYFNMHMGIHLFFTVENFLAHLIFTT